MQTRLSADFLDTAAGQAAERVLRSCVHCGFCNATCPTYQLLGDELDGPRGRIYQIKQLLEGEPADVHLQQHLDRCLSCHACETTCPSGVEYHILLDIGRERLERQVARPWRVRLLRYLLRSVVPYRRRFGALARIGQRLRPLLPPGLRRYLPPRPAGRALDDASFARFVVLLEGCVQPALAPQINTATQRVLNRLGIGVETAANAACCGALPHHLSDSERTLTMARANIDAWWPLIERGAEAIVVNASGCAPMVKDYGRLLQADPAYAARAARVSSLTRDLSEFLRQCDLSALDRGNGDRIAFHSPCTLQHGQRLGGVVEALLERLGYELTPVRDAHLCCGSAGTYSILQPALSQQLLERKLKNLEAPRPALIASANIGCLLHLQSQATLPVKHWIELLDQ